MYNIRKLNDDLFYIGCSDRRLQLFESAYPIPEGISYNSYLLKDEKTVLFDTVDKSCASQFFENLKASLGDRNLDYLVIHHMEPDHASLISEVKSFYPSVKIVCTTKAQAMIKQFFDFDIDACVYPVKDGDVLNTGKHELKFILAPMVHWPEVMLTYDKTYGALFSADAFGSFGAINGNLFDNEVNWQRDYLDEARRYYTNIVGKYGLQVQMLLKKVADFDIKLIYPLHGLIIKENINLFIEKYDKWSTYTPEEKSVLIAYTSVYGNTKRAVEKLAEMIEDKGQKVVVNDLARCDMAEAVEDAFRYGKIIFATTTYNGDVFPFMKEFINHLVERNFQKKTVGFIENGSWAPMAARVMKTMLEKCKDLKFTESNVKIMSALNSESEESLKALAEEICKD